MYLSAQAASGEEVWDKHRSTVLDQTPPGAAIRWPLPAVQTLLELPSSGWGPGTHRDRLIPTDHQTSGHSSIGETGKDWGRGGGLGGRDGWVGWGWIGDGGGGGGGWEGEW